MVNIGFGKRLSVTQSALKRKYPKLSDAAIKRIDRYIKKEIAKDDDFLKVLGYVKTELAAQNISKYKFRQNCSELAQIYLESNGHWMFQENLFCFFSLIISVIWMLAQFIELFCQNAWLTSDDTQLGMYFSCAVLFLLIDKLRRKRKMEGLNTFLFLLNGHAPGTVMVGMILCYCARCLSSEVWLSAFLILCAILLPIFSVVITWIESR